MQAENYKFTFGSLFTGVGGFDLGFERAGMRCAWQVEIDHHCIEVLERHYPKVRRYTDVRTVGKENLEPVDLICGGFPCQDLSVAGKRAGFDGERSSLWFEFERIVAEMQPKWVVIENVPGLLSSRNGSDFGVILKSLDGFGYGVAWRILDSQYFGVPQRRRRVFIVASLGNPGSGEVLFEREGVPGDIAEGRETGERTTAYAIRRAQTSSNGWGISVDKTHTLDETGGDAVTALILASGQANAEIASERRTALTGLHEQPIVASPAVVFQQNQRDEVRDLGDKAGAIASEPGMHQQNFLAIGHSGGETLKFNTKVNTLNAQTGSETATMFNGVWEMSHPDDVICDSGDVVPTLQKRMGTGGNQVPMVGVRRLTPTECCRLQGFPDNWNDNVSDTQRYKQMGNAVTVNVIEWIGERIINHDRL